jgi:hypothetical protein
VDAHVQEVTMRSRGRFEHELAHLELRRQPSPAGLQLRQGYGGQVTGEAGGAPITLTHYHVRKAIDPSIRALMADPSPGVMTPARMTPGYLLPSDPRRQALQKALDTLLQTNYAEAIAAPVHLRIGLVDLTGVRYHAPVFAGHWAWGPGTSMEGGSLPKILPLYALYQLRFDLDTVAAQQGITKAAALLSTVHAAWKKEGLASPPNVLKLFTIVERPGQPVVARLRQTHDVHHNWVARSLIVHLGFGYIGSVALQSGLFDPAVGGLWLNAAYNQPALTWWSSPFPKVERHSATALATATFFTLLAQGRLVNEATSRQIRDVLAMRLCMQNGPLDGIRSLGGIPGMSANKCGDLKPYYHEGAHVVRKASADRTLSYAFGVLSHRPPRPDLTQLGRDLDALIAAAPP